VLEDERRIEPPKLPEQPDDFRKYYTPGGRDQVKLRAFKNGKWETPIDLTDANRDINGVAIGFTGQGGFWVVYSDQKIAGTHRLYGRPLDSRGRFGDEVEITQGVRDLKPVMCTAANGDPLLAYQMWQADRQAVIRLLRFYPERRWQFEFDGSHSDGNSWHPAIAAGPDGWHALACDSYTQGNYDVTLLDGARQTAGNASWASTIHRIASTSKFEARPSVVYDKTGRVWIAFEEGPEQWGKDYGALDSKAGKPLYNERNIRVVTHKRVGEKSSQNGIAAELPVSKYDPPALPFEAVKTNQFERVTRYAYPTLGLDGNGNVWLAYRQNFGTRYTTHPGPYWLTFVRRLEGDRWSEPIEVHHSDGLLDHRPVLLPHASGGLLIVHNTDGRYTTPERVDNQIYASVVNLPGTPAAPKLTPHDAGKNALAQAADVKAEFEAVARMRKHRFAAGGKNYQYLRGEYHRHTEMSWDGAPDGSLEDMFRYAIDAVKFDWIGNGDHDNGAGREYSWWLTQKLTDAYAVPGKFTPMFTYERSVGYPHGHRNVMFAQRGIRTLPRLAPPLDPPLAKGGKGGAVAGIHADDTKMLYRYLKEFNGICAMHTSATGMGTDWRDNDPAVEPIVEIYQGDRMSYEHPGAPRAGFDPKSGMEPANVGGWEPLGFVNLALKEKGYKLGFQASSDHWSTHISFFTVLVEDTPRKGVQDDRQALLDAVKKRHCYGATDNILVDFRCGEAIMGDETTVTGAPEFKVYVAGTATLDKIEMLRDSEVVASLIPKDSKPAPNWSTTWTDPQPLAGTHYYYIRALQTDGEIAWASPIWVTRK
jgi:hypothetical protein